MRTLPSVLTLLVAFFLGAAFADSSPQSKEPGKEQKGTAKESLVAKHCPDSVKALQELPYPDTAKGKSLANSAAKMLNTAEEMFLEAKSLRATGKEEYAILATLEEKDTKRLLALTAFIMVGRLTTEEGDLPAQKYTVSWDGANWNAKEVPKKK